jgi:hypothetical protein
VARTATFFLPSGAQLAAAWGQVVGGKLCEDRLQLTAGPLRRSEATDPLDQIAILSSLVARNATFLLALI